MAITATLLYSGPLLAYLTTRVSFYVISYRYTAYKPKDTEGMFDLLFRFTNVSTAFYLIGFIGLILVNVVLFTRRNREAWFYYSVILLSIIWCLQHRFPIGFIFGLPVIFVFYKRRAEFGH